MLPSGEPSASAPATADHGSALAEGHQIAGGAGRSPGSADLLLGVLRSGGAAARVLAERGLVAAHLEPLLPHVRPEPRLDVREIARASHDIAAHLGAPQTSSLHLLLALLRAGGSAVELLRAAGHDPAKVRSFVLRALTASTAGTGRAPARGSPRQTHQDAEPLRAPAATRTPAPQPLAHAAPPVSDDWELVAVEPPRTPVIHRDRELGRLLDLLQAKTARVLAIVGDPGAGRTALLAALAAGAGEKPVAPLGPFPPGISPGAIVQELHRRAPAGAPIAIDGCAILGPEDGDGPAQLLATARAGRRWILTATPGDLRRFEIGTPDLATSLETVTLAPLAPESLLEVLEVALDSLSESEAVAFSPEVRGAVLRLAPRYPSDRAQPGRSIAIAEVAAARVGRLGRAEVTEADVAEVVADAAGVPVVRLLRTDDERFRSLEARLAERVVGHEHARGRIADILRRSYAGFRGRRPLASLLLLGPTGVGKTETARAIADALFDGEDALVRIDLSEYNEPHALARLIGSPPGYVGYEEGGQLTEAIRRRPASVVLLDELEKAHREVLLVLLQVLEDGRLTDGRGRSVDFSAAAIVMTSNLGSACYRAERCPDEREVLASARDALPPELWNRIDEVLAYAPLDDAELGSIVARIAAESSRRLSAERGISFRVERAVVDHVLRSEPDRTLGARPLRRAFERLVEGPLATEILAGRVRRGARLLIRFGRNGELSIRPEV